MKFTGRADMDEFFMRLAVRQAMRGIGRTCPNPPVGAVVVREGEIVGTGYHPKAGEPHAEVFALRAAGDKARGATLYVTLEPCCHTGRTPPCTEAVMASGIREVVFAVNDPSPHCAGAGERRLCGCGMETRRGPCAALAQRVMAPFLKRVRTGLPLVTAKWAMSLDGKTAAPGGDSRWISGLQARAFAHRLRSRVGAVLIGSSTALKDDPLLTCRLSGRRQPIRVVADSRARISPRSQLALSAFSSPVLLAHLDDAPAASVAALRAAGIRTAPVPASTAGGIGLEPLLRGLATGAFGFDPVDHVMLEGGGTLTAAAIEAGLVDRVACVVAPVIIGGADSRTPVEGKGVSAVAEALESSVTGVRRLGPDLLIEADLRI